ncbi:sterol 24-C-methyltransferase [Dendrothele bispora CBS 962.96]|uniref:Sterol 24-C-methyltransferase n=1 Tax=Dendrothele bispora (strain CBS 962.96) TaxID=1314807 RepID=A0A4V4HGD3_DENBC|nr:sterol 24-C-methyltransferase [Dendrothele bispora CBS 962.96]
MAIETRTIHADGREDERVQNYTKFWQNDTSKEAQVDNDNRLQSYADVVNGYYDGATDLYEWCWSQNFHFSRFYKGESFTASQARHEHYLAFKMGIKPSGGSGPGTLAPARMKVLDVGCGVGGPAREIATFMDCEVVGLNNNEFQIGRAKKCTRKMGLEDKVTFVKGDFMKLVEQFGENSFDAVYAIEATVHAPTWEGVYGEIYKVLKPGGIFGVYEWCMTDAWNHLLDLGLTHVTSLHEIELGNGIPEMRSLRLARQALKNVGFEILHEEDLAERPDEVKWYYPLEGDYTKAQTFRDYLLVFQTTWFGMLVMHSIVWVMERVGMVPKGTMDVAQALKVALTSLVKGGQTKLFTPMYLVVSKKPLKAVS